MQDLNTCIDNDAKPTGHTPTQHYSHNRVKQFTLGGGERVKIEGLFVGGERVKIEGCGGEERVKIEGCVGGERVKIEGCGGEERVKI